MAGQHWVQFVFVYTGLVLMVITLIIWIRDLNRHQLLKKSKEQKMAIIYCTLSILLGLIYMIWLLTIDTVSFQVYNETCISCQKAAKYGISFLIYQRVFLYLFYLHRIFTAFGGTALAFTPKSYKCSKYSVNIIFAVLTIAYIIWCIYIDTVATEISEEDPDAYLYLVYPLVLADFICGISCMVLFIRRLRKLIKIIKTIETTNSQHTNDRSNPNAESIKYEYTVKKLTFLSSIQVISTNLIFIVINVVGVIDNIIVIDTWLNSVCLMLAFKMYDNVYQSIFCCDYFRNKMTVLKGSGSNPLENTGDVRIDSETSANQSDPDVVEMGT